MHRSNAVSKAALTLCFAALCVCLKGCVMEFATTSTSSTSTTYTSTSTVSTSTITPTTTTTTTINPTVVHLNTLYNRTDTGVPVRTFDFYDAPTPWLCETGKRLSFMVTNTFAWKNGGIGIYQGTGPNWGQYGGVIANDAVLSGQMAKCLYPRDADTKMRMLDGCGCHQWKMPRPATGKAWCSHHPENDCPADECAYHPSSLAQMLQDYRDGRWAKENAPPPAWNTYNEAVIDGEQWNNNLKGSVLAFWLPKSCKLGSQCSKDAMRYVGLWKKQYGDIPVVGLDTSKAVDPFYVLDLKAYEVQVVEVVV